MPFFLQKGTMKSMEISLISLKSIAQLRQSKKKLWFCLGGIALLWIIFTVLAFVFQNRLTQHLWIAFGSVVTSLCFIVSAFIVAKIYAPIRHYQRFSEEALSHERIINKVRISRLDSDSQTYKGFKTLGFEAEEVDEGNRKLFFRYEETAKPVLEVGHTYEVEAFDDIVVRIKELA
jgi:hypothetical protein